MYKQLVRFFFIAFLGLGLIACSDSNSPEKIVNDFYTYLNKKDFDKASELVYVGDLQDSGMMSQDKVKMMMFFVAEAMEKQGGIKNIKVNSVEYSEDKSQAKASVSVEMANGSVETDDVNLISQNGKWKIMMSDPAKGGANQDPNMNDNVTEQSGEVTPSE